MNNSGIIRHEKYGNKPIIKRGPGWLNELGSWIT